MFEPATQFSIFLTNKPAVLSQVCNALADKHVNLMAITLMDSVEHGVVRLVPMNVEKCRVVLQGLDLPMTETEVLKTVLPNKPGALADVCTRLNAEKISIRYAYVTAGASGGKTTGIFKVNDANKALKLKASKSNKSTGRAEKKVSRKSRGRKG